MIVGDSVTYEIQPGLTAALEHTGLVTSANRTQVGFGLSRWPIYPWWDVWETFLDEVQPEAVVIQAGIWDVAEVFAGELRRPVPTDPDWDEQFTFLMEAAVDVLSSDGAIVYWQTMLPSTSPGPGGRLNDLVADLADRDDRVVMVDFTPAFTRNGGYTGFVERDGVEWPIRKVDGVHLCREGSEIAGRVTAEAIATELGEPLGEPNIAEFANGEIHCRFSESIRGCDAFIIQSHSNFEESSINDTLMEQLIMVDAARRASAKRTHESTLMLSSPRRVLSTSPVTPIQSPR
jgi:hypothetical protein